MVRHIASFPAHLKILVLGTRLVVSCPDSTFSQGKEFGDTSLKALGLSKKLRVTNGITGQCSLNKCNAEAETEFNGAAQRQCCFS